MLQVQSKLNVNYASEVLKPEYVELLFCNHCFKRKNVVPVKCTSRKLDDFTVSQ